MSNKSLLEDKDRAYGRDGDKGKEALNTFK